MNFTCIALSMALLVTGIIFFTGRGIPRIKAWQNTSQAERDSIDADRLGRNVAVLFLLAGVFILLAGVNMIFRENIFIWCMIGWFVLAGADIYFISKSGRYIKK